MQARVALEEWRRDYNTVRPHSRIGWLTPDAYAAQFSAQRAKALRSATAPRLGPLLDRCMTSQPPNSGRFWIKAGGNVSRQTNKAPPLWARRGPVKSSAMRNFIVEAAAASKISYGTGWLVRRHELEAGMMTFEIRKISGTGTSHPVVARLGPQTSELVNWIDLDRTRKDAVLDLYVNTLTQRLLRCHEIRDGLVQKMEDCVKNLSRQNDCKRCFDRTFSRR